MAQVIIMHIKRGKTRVEVEGCTGQECQILTKPLEEKLGPIVSRENKPEAFEQHSTTEVHGQQG